ncbi:MAG: superoxide dismutase, Cu, Zn [uncultured bacterium]|nr:MAG: superoxide dismutase, Cu, Zn [uncultured bacterium]
MLNKTKWILLFSVATMLSTPIFADITVTVYSIKDPKKSLGTITFKDDLYGLVIQPNLHGLSAGMHGIHVHEHDRCDEGGNKAGGHYDPKNTQQHLGPFNTEGHLGDLPAIYVDDRGASIHPVLAPRLQERDMYGHSIIIHEGNDNYSDFPKPMGGGGNRIACAVIPKKITS